LLIMFLPTSISGRIPLLLIINENRGTKGLHYFTTCGRLPITG
jgi:hypothetical protein